MLIFKPFRPQNVVKDIIRGHGPGIRISPENVQKVFENCGDLVTRTVAAGGTSVTLFACWMDGTVSGVDVSQCLLRPLTDPERFGAVTSAEDAAALLEAGAVYGHDMTRTEDMGRLAEALSYGSCAVVLEGAAYLFQLKTDQHRTIQEPTVEKSVKASKDAFVENLRVNTGLLRSRLRTPRLKLRQTTVGSASHTAAAVVWLEGAAPPELPGEMLRRLENAELKGLILPDAIDAALADQPLSPFPQLIHTERPDKLAAALLSGRAALLVEGIPVAFAAPACLPEFMKTSEDLSQHWTTATCIRLMRWSAVFITLLLPALYVAVAMFHAEMIPTQLLLSVIKSKQSVPFSSSAEVLGMLLAFEFIQEAGLRLPDPVGQTVSIIGALIVGQSAVEAKVISPIAVIVVAMAGIAGYTMPSQDLGAALRIFRFLLTAAAALAGMFGIFTGLVLLLWHVCSLESYGYPYVFAIPAGEDVFIRRPPGRKGEQTL